MSKIPEITKIIKGAMARNGYNISNLSEVTGIPYQTIRLQRFRDPGSWRFYEWGALKKHISFTPEELKMIEEKI